VLELRVRVRFCNKRQVDVQWRILATVGRIPDTFLDNVPYHVLCHA